MAGLVELQVLSKSEQWIDLFFLPVTGTVDSISLYVSLTDVVGNYVELKKGIANTNKSTSDGNVYIRVTLAELQALGAPFNNANFTNTILFFRAITIIGGVPSSLAAALPKNIGVVGYTPASEADNPIENIHAYHFSQEALAWERTRGSAAGAVAVTSSPLYEDNITIERTFSGSDLATELIYFTNAPSGSYAKLVTYTSPWVAGVATKTVYSDATKP